MWYCDLCCESHGYVNYKQVKINEGLSHRQMQNAATFDHGSRLSRPNTDNGRTPDQLWPSTSANIALNVQETRSFDLGCNTCVQNPRDTKEGCERDHHEFVALLRLQCGNDEFQLTNDNSLRCKKLFHTAEPCAVHDGQTIFISVWWCRT